MMNKGKINNGMIENKLYSANPIQAGSLKFKIVFNKTINENR